ncbi:hypothetical protein [Sulfitobacter sp. M22]|uniref:hypothetical protein n=1 Tax=Sulfitobacter sp. M22 TaxID=2675332 RepID=UPI001F36423E|nr:hypothetical protein [Sulfitobacter sp. M22]MCF7725761.1 hypothetical protein [Sulfitobacter sp. M22]
MNVLEKLEGMQEQSASSIQATKDRLASFERAAKQVDDVLIFLRTAKEDLGRIGLVPDVTLGADALVSINFYLPDVQVAVVNVATEAAQAVDPAELTVDSEPVDEQAAAAVPFARRQPSKPVKKPRSGAKAMKAGPREYQVGPFTDHEIALIGKAMDDGKSRDEIADLVKRSKISVGMKIKALNKERARKPRPVAAAPAPVKLNVKELPKPAPVAKPAVAAPMTPKLTADERIVVAHLDGLGYSGGWSADKDFEILSGLITGKAAALVADELGVEVGDVVARFKALNTKVGDIGHQSRLLRILRQRAGA